MRSTNARESSTRTGRGGRLRGLIVAGAALTAVGLAGFLACEEVAPFDPAALQTFEVSVIEGEVGDTKAPIPYNAQVLEFTVDIRALRGDGEVDTSFTGDVHVAVGPRGRLAKDQPEWIKLQDGVAEAVTIKIERAHGEVAIWIEDIGDDDDPGTYATGLSPSIHIGNPTVRQVQETDKFRTSALDGDFVRFNLDGRTAVVTGVMNDGFYTTDLSEPEGVYNSIFVFTHSRPHGVETGSRIVSLAGTAEDFFGFTEVSFPSWKVDGRTDLPEPIELLPAHLANNNTMESYESSLVEVRNVTVCPTGEGFATFGQWVVLLDPSGDCGGEAAITVLSSYTVPWFDPPAHVGETLPVVRGALRYHLSARPQWILYPRQEDDIVAP